MPVNKDPFVRTRNKDGVPSIVRLPVQAGSTQAIKIGEICVYNKTASYVVPISAVSDFIYAILIAREEQKSTDSARMLEFYSLHPDDEFEFALSASRSLALGDRFILNASNSQQLVYSATAYPICRSVDDGHYPETGTTIRTQSYARVSFNVACSYWGLIQNGVGWNTPKQVTSTSALTLYPEMSGLTIIHQGASTAEVIHILPTAGTAPVGTYFKVINLSSATGTVSFDPGSASGIYVDGSLQTDDEDRGITQTAATGSYMVVQAINSNDWYAYSDSGSGTAQAIA